MARAYGPAAIIKGGAEPMFSSRLMSPSWQGLRVLSMLSGSKNRSSSPLWSCLWLATVAITGWSQWTCWRRNGSLRSCSLRSAFHLVVL